MRKREIAAGMFSVLLGAFMLTIQPFAALALEVRGVVGAVEAGARLQIDLPKGVAVSVGDVVKIEAVLPGLGPVILQSRWRIERTGPERVIASPIGAPSGDPQTGNNAIIETSAAQPGTGAMHQAGVNPTSQAPDLATSPAAAVTPGRACDRLAAHPFDRGQSDAGVKFEEIRTDDAIRACRLAVEIHPGKPRYADQLGRALEAAQQGSEALRWYHKAADAGHLRAILYLVSVYSSSSRAVEIKGVAKDDQKAIRFLRQAAEMGHARAMRELGLAYYRGEWLKTDRRKALEWVLKAERAAGEPDKTIAKNLRQYMLAHAHHHGFAGMARDDEIAAFYMLEALIGGHEFARQEMTTNWRPWSKPFRQHLQRLMRAEGVYAGAIDGVFGDGTKAAIAALAETDLAASNPEPRNVEPLQSPQPQIKISDEAAAGIVKAAQKGRVEDMLLAGSLYSGLFGKESHGSWRDDQKTEYWYRAAAAKGDVDGMFHLASHYRNRRDDNAEAARWYRRAAENGHLDSMMLLSKMILGGAVKAADKDETRRWLRKAAEKGNGPAMYELAGMYHKGLGGAVDMERAVHWYRRSASKGSNSAMYDLGTILIHGEGGIAVRIAEGLQWYLNAAESGHRLAMFSLGEIYLKGEGVAKEPVKAKYWLEEAAMKGQPAAMYSLSLMYDAGIGITPDPHTAAGWMVKALERHSQRAAHNLTTDWEKWSLEFRKEFQRQLRAKEVFDGVSEGQFGPSTAKAIQTLATRTE